MHDINYMIEQNNEKSAEQPDATLRAADWDPSIRTDDSGATLRTDDGPGTNWQTGNIPGEKTLVAGEPAIEGTLVSASTDNLQNDLQDDNLKKGNLFVLKAKEYRLVRLIAKSGEADVFEVTHKGETFVLKHYYSNVRPKKEILDTLASLKRKDVISPIDHGYVQERFYEINEYMQGGTLRDVFSGGAVRDMEKIRMLVAQIAEALHACHQVRIIHRDIKPDNFFFRDKDRKELVVADFGISSIHYEGISAHITTNANRTITYTSPEQATLVGGGKEVKIDPKTDYYALGISLLEAWKGSDPFDDVEPYDIPRIKQNGRVVIPKEAPRELENLIRGLITVDTVSRWGYDEIQKWLRGEPVSVLPPAMDLRFENYVFDQFKGIAVGDPKDLAYHMEKDPDRAAAHLHSGMIKDWLAKTSKDLAAEVSTIYEKEYLANTPQGTKAAVTKAIYVLDKYKPYRSFDGSVWSDLTELSRHIEQNERHYRSELKKHTADLYLFLEARGARDQAERYRSFYKQFPEEKAFRLVILDLKDYVLSIDGHTFVNPGQLSGTSNELREKLIEEVKNPLSQVSVWLEAVSPELLKNLDTFRTLQRFDVPSLNYALKIGGIKAGDQEAMNQQELYQLFCTDPTLFFKGTELSALQRETEYWLKNYQESSFVHILAFYVKDERFSFPAARDLYQYLLTDGTIITPFELNTLLAADLAGRLNGDTGKIKELAAISKAPMQAEMDTIAATKDWHIDVIYHAVNNIEKVSPLFPAFAEALLMAINDKIENDIDADHKLAANNIQHFGQLRDILADFVLQKLAPIAKHLPYIKHWEAEEALMTKRSEKYLLDSLEKSINYLGKGKKFHRIFVFTMLSAISVTFFIYSVVVHLVSLPAAFGSCAVFWLLGVWLLSRIKKRSPNRGLGSLFDPVHRYIGKALYKPFLKSILSDRESPRYKSAMQAVVSAGAGELFKEKVRISLLGSNELYRELAGVRK